MLRLFFRLNPPEAAHARLSMTGVASQFGFDEAELVSTLRKLLTQGTLDQYGLHVYYGTQVTSPESLELTMRQVLAAAERLRESTSLAPGTIDFGGGFPWPYGAENPTPDLDAMRLALASAFADSDVTGQRWFESGRFISASAGTLLATVRDVKQSRGRRFVILDAGINHFGGMAGLGRIHLPRLSVTPLGPATPASDEPATLVGPLCTPLDVIARDQPMPEVVPGDIVQIPNVGAYAATASLTAFLSRPAAGEVAVRGDTEIAAFRLRTGHERASVAAQWAGM
jgi:diaminopimelate decarboxylase